MLASGREEGGRNSNCERRGERGKVGVAYLGTRGVERKCAIIATFLGPYFVPDGEA